jgi:hypothetical protein
VKTHGPDLVYPVSGALAETGSTRTGTDGLARLIGPNRARVLRLLEQPRSTTQLAGVTRNTRVGSVCACR